MGENTKIEWTDHTFNPWRGCAKVHAGCQHCYAETLAARGLPGIGPVVWGPNGTRVVAENWDGPRKWNTAAERAGVRRKVFCASLADVFEDWPGPIVNSHGVEMVVCHGCQRLHSSDVDCQGGEEACERVPRKATMDDVRRRLFDLIDQTPWLDWQLVTKRPENIRRMVPPYSHHACITGDCPHDLQSQCDLSSVQYRENVWIGTSISDQASADKQLPALQRLRDLTPVLFVSIEPLLGPLDISPWIPSEDGFVSQPPEVGGTRHIRDGAAAVDWVIVGGESGAGARAMHSDWVRTLRDQCQAANPTVPFLFKQWGEWLPSGMVEDETEHTCSLLEGTIMCRVGKKTAGRVLDGRTWDEFPDVLETGAA